MQTTTLSYANIHQHGELFANLFRARRQSFIVQKNWDLPQADGMEFDQYDTAQSRWVAVHDQGEILAGFRLTPTTAQCGIYSYMIRDAQRGILGGSIPKDLLHEEAPVCQTVWECSRGFVSHAIPQARRRGVHMAMTAAMSTSARELGAGRLLTLILATWPRWLRRCNMSAKEAGRKLWIDDAYFQCVEIDLTSKMN